MCVQKAVTIFPTATMYGMQDYGPPPPEMQYFPFKREHEVRKIFVVLCLVMFKVRSGCLQHKDFFIFLFIIYIFFSYSKCTMCLCLCVYCVCVFIIAFLWPQVSPSRYQQSRSDAYFSTCSLCRFLTFFSLLIYILGSF